MISQFEILDLAELRANTPEGENLYFQLPRLSNDVWQVVSAPAAVDTAAQWSTVKRGQSVPVPLIPYLVHPDLTAIFAFGLCIGFANNKITPKELRIFVGSPATQLEDHRVRMFVGIAAKV